MKYIFSVLIFIILFFPSISIAENLKVFLLQSYGVENSTGLTQLYGVKDALSQLKRHGYDIKLREFYMNTKKKNIAPVAIRQIAKSAYHEIGEFNPDYIVTFDDNAFRYVAIEHLLDFNARKSWKVIFTGLNKSYFDYKQEYRFDESRVGGIEELVQLKKLHRWFDSVQFIPTKFYILKDNSPSSYYLALNVEFELKKYGHKNYEMIHIDNLPDLRRKLKDLNGRSLSVIFAMQTAILDTVTGEVLTIRKIQKEIVRQNTTHFEVTVNQWSTKPDVGFAVSVGFDFWEMGNSAGQIIVDSVLSETGKFQNRVTTAVGSLSVNTKRMTQLALVRYYKDALNQFNRIYTTIKD